MGWPISESNYLKLLGAIDSALAKALHDSTKSEPQLIANLVWNLPREINSVSLSSDLVIKAGGVFVHSQPFVRSRQFPDKKKDSVELGDVLFLRSEVKDGEVRDRRAMLFQAKKFNNLPVVPNDLNQHRLYSEFPSFEYTRSTDALNGKSRSVSGPDIYNAAKYLLLGERGSCRNLFSHDVFFSRHCESCTLTAQPTEPELSYYRCFHKELIDFVIGNAGKSFETPPPKKTRGWDRVIEDLTKITAERVSVYVQRASSGTSNMRGPLCFRSSFLPEQFPEQSILASSGCYRCQDNSSDGDMPPDIPNEWQQDKDWNGGISIVEFFVEKKGIQRLIDRV